MSHASAKHRAMDRACDQAIAHDGEPDEPLRAGGLVRSRQRAADMRSLGGSRVLLLELEVRAAAGSGRTFYTGWLGRARVIGFPAPDPNDRGHQVIQIFVETPAPRNMTSAGASRAPAREAASGRPSDRPADNAAPGAPAARQRPV